MISWSEIRTLLRSALRWWWVILLATALAGGTAFYLSRFETRYYVARTSLMIGNTLDTSLPNADQLGISSSLARYYGEVARREPILSAVATELQLPFTWQYLSDYMLTTNVVPSANLLEITVEDSNPERAAAIANLIGEKLIALSPTSPEKIEAQTKAIDQQMQDTNTKIEALKIKIATITQQRDNANSASDQAELNQQLDQLNLSLSQEETTYRSLLGSKNDSVVNSITFFEHAVTPTTPLASKRMIAVAAAGMAGFLLSLMAIFVLDRLDSRWRGKADIEQRFHMVDLGNVPSGPPIVSCKGEAAIKRELAIREVHTNLMLAAPDGVLKTLLVSSPQPSQDRSALTIDLAYLFARAGLRVLLIDADLSTPHLTNMLRSEQPHSRTSSVNDKDIWAHLEVTAIQNVVLLPSTIEGTDSPVLVPSLRWPELVKQLQTVADVVIFDGPSALSSADAALLAPYVDGSVLVVSPKSDDREEVYKSKERLMHRQGAKLLGAVTFHDRKPWEADPNLKQIPMQEFPALPPKHGTTVIDGLQRDEKEDGTDEHETIITPPPDSDTDEVNEVGVLQHNVR